MAHSGFSHDNLSCRKKQGENKQWDLEMVATDVASGHAQCTRQFALIAARNAKFHSSRQKAGRSIVPTAFQSTGHPGTTGPAIKQAAGPRVLRGPNPPNSFFLFFFLLGIVRPSVQTRQSFFYSLYIGLVLLLLRETKWIRAGFLHSF